MSRPVHKKIGLKQVRIATSSGRHSMSASMRSGSLDASAAAAKKGGRRFSCPPGTLVESAVTIKRAPFTQTAFDEIHLKSDDHEKKTLSEKLRSKCYCSRQKLFKFFAAYLPIIKVLRYYNIKDFLVTDILAGVTIGILHIPQALAFGLLTSVKIENGLYTSVWPVILYVLFGTSAHVSMGTSAVICIVTAAVVDRQADIFKLENPHLMSNATGNGTLLWEDIPEFMDFKEATAMGIAFFTGMILMTMGVLKLGFITAYLSDSFFSAFTSGAGVHIATSQIPAILGLKVPRFSGVFKIVKTYSAIFGAISAANVAALIIALLSMIAILFVKDYLNEKLKGKIPIPIPVELLVVIVATIVSYAGNLSGNFGVDIVESIPNTIPAPVMPVFDGVETYIVDCFVLAILIFANTIAMAKICAKRHNYEVDDSQELIAYGMCNFASSFLRCFPSAVAPPRTMVASAMNTKTTVCGVFSTALLILLILVMSTLFEPLPKSALAAIIFISLKGLFIQLKDCVKFWHVNKIDFVIWFFTLFSVVFLDIDFGLGIGVVVSLITVVFQAQFARGYRLGRTMKDVTVVEHKKYADSIETSGIKVYRFHSNLFFANAEIFRTALYRTTVNPRKILKFIKKQERLKAKEEKSRKSQVDGESYMYKPEITMEIPGITVNGDNAKVNENKSEPATISNGREFMRLESTPSTASNGSYKGSLVGIDNPVYTNKEDQFSTLDIPQEYNLNRRNMSIATITTIGSLDESIDPEDGQEVVTEEKIRRLRRIHHVIIDLSTCNYMDISGANVISHIFKEYAHVNIKVFLSNVSYDVRQTMHFAGVFDTIPKDNIFVDVLDAIAVAKLEMVVPIPEEGLEDFTIEEAAEDKYVTNI
ncbi:prestin-like isoform X1 [Ruditapes philippinarum]|uniref:prestin-like isoform X1 n=2 Tax=Ruditapes philippinarum TaxID=129788 RepID=UPI00295A6290|nr:prestin-like isoform X1 [Ruditapes philippinarum]